MQHLLSLDFQASHTSRLFDRSSHESRVLRQTPQETQMPENLRAASCSLPAPLVIGMPDDSMCSVLDPSASLIEADQRPLLGFCLCVPYPTMTKNKSSPHALS